MAFFERNTRLLIILTGCLLFIPFLGSIHLFDWDEVNFAECAREMNITGDVMTVQLNFKPFWEKPPLFIWLSAISMKIFGVNEFAARFPNAVCGIITMLVLYNSGKRFSGPRFGALWALSYVGSTLPQFYFHSGIIDPWFNLFIFCGIDRFARYAFSKKDGVQAQRPMLWASAAFIGLALLTKGPAALVIFGAAVAIYMVLSRFRATINFADAIQLLLIIILTGGCWFIMLALTGKTEVIQHFISYQVHLFGTEDSGHGGPFYYHVVVLLVGCFPCSIIAMPSFMRDHTLTVNQKYYKWWMMILFWVVLILFSVVKTKIIHYSSLCYYPLAFLSALTLNRILAKHAEWRLRNNILLTIVGFVFAAILIIIPIAAANKERLLSRFDLDEFAKGNMQADVHWNGWEWMVGGLLLVALTLCVIKTAKGKYASGLVWLLGANAIVTTLASIVLAPKIEEYAQGSAIRFFQAHSSGNEYVAAISYHSYAQYYYSNRQPSADRQRLSADWMLRGPIDKPAYFITKVTEVSNVEQNYPELKETGRSNGYVFYRRDPTVNR